MGFLDSRHLSLFDVPAPIDIRAKFVYNFFVSDERVNNDGMERFQGAVNSEVQKEIDVRIVETKTPRYVEIDFSPVIIKGGNIQDANEQNTLSENKELVQSEVSVTTERDVSIKYQDPDIRRRIAGKAFLLPELFGLGDANSAMSIELISSLNEGLDADSLEEVMAANITRDTFLVNEVGDLFEIPVFSRAASMAIDLLVDRRLLKPFFAGDYTAEGLSKKRLLTLAENDALKFLPVATDDSGADSDEPTIEVLSADRRTADSDDVASMTVGYIIERIEIKSDGAPGKPVRYFIDGESSTRFLDTKILYGSTYRYVVKTVALIKMTVESNGEENLEPGFFEVLFLLSSTASPSQMVNCVETIPPLEPDGIFYRFNYDDGRGLFIRWQMPVGKQRDTKYFQVFRRKTIYDPFTCIMEIDFDDSVIRSPKTERVLEAKVIDAPGPMTSIMDPGFDRSAGYIYAIAAVDAHGLTSGYSAQTLVTFDRVSNQLKLKNISRSGAPKQYPNFFIDPDLDDNIFVDSFTQDSMQSSRKFSVKIYFDPDAARYNTAAGDSLPLLTTDNDQGFYKLHLLNIDRQKAATLELRVNDLRFKGPYVITPRVRKWLQRALKQGTVKLASDLNGAGSRSKSRRGERAQAGPRAFNSPDGGN